MNDRSYVLFKHSARAWVGAALLTISLGAGALAQQPQQTAKNADERTTLAAPISARADQTVVSSLATLPEADALIYISPQRILNDALPHVLADSEVQGLRLGIAEVKQQVGIDAAGIEYVVVAARFNKPTADLNFSPPQFLVVTGGDFSSEAAMVLVRMALEGKLHDEAYGGKTISLVTIPEVAKELGDNPFAKALSELAVAPLNGNTIAAGSVAYVKAAIDGMGAAETHRVNPQLLQSLLRDPNALVSIAGSPGTAFAKSFGLLGTETTPRASKCDSKLGDFYAGVTMDATLFKIRGAMNADNPDTAKIFQSLLVMALEQGKKYAKDKSAQTVLNTLTITPTETEVVVSADISQQQVADFIKEKNAPKKPETVPPPVKKRRHHRRHTQRAT